VANDTITVLGWRVLWLSATIYIDLPSDGVLGMAFWSAGGQTKTPPNKASFSVVVPTDDNGRFSGNVRVCNKDVMNTEERVKVAGFSGMWWLYNCLKPQPDTTGYNKMQPASIQQCQCLILLEGTKVNSSSQQKIWLFAAHGKGKAVPLQAWSGP